MDNRHMTFIVKNVDLPLLMEQRRVLIRLLQFDHLALMHQELCGLVHFIDACEDAALESIKEEV